MKLILALGLYLLIESSQGGFLEGLFGKHHHKATVEYSSIDLKENIVVNVVSQWKNKWQYGTWYMVYPWEQNAHLYESWISNGGKTGVTNVDFLRHSQAMLQIFERRSMEWLLQWFRSFLELSIIPHSSIKMNFGKIPKHLLKFRPLENRDYLSWFYNIFKFCKDGIADPTNELSQVFDVALGKLNFLKGVYRKTDFIAFQLKTKSEHVLVQTLGESLNAYYQNQYQTWQPQITQWLLNVFFRYLFSLDKKRGEFELPQMILNIFPNIKPDEYKLIILHLIGKVINDKEVSHEVLELMKVLRSKINKVVKNKCIKWIYYKNRYLPIGDDGQLVPDIEPVWPDENSIYIIKWIDKNGIKTPLGFDGQPLIVDRIPKIIRWYCVNKRYIPIGEGENSIPNFKPITANEKHPLILRWILQNKNYVPQTDDNETPEVHEIVKWKELNGMFVPIGTDRKPIATIKPLAPGEQNIFVTWKHSPKGLILIGPDGKESSVDRAELPKVIRWIVINNRYIPIGKNEKPIPGIQPIKQGQECSLVKKWINVHNELTPLVNKDEVVKIIKVSKFIKQGNKLVCIDTNENNVPGLSSLKPGETNPYVSWKWSDNGFIPVGPDEKPVKLEIVKLKQLKIFKWVIISGKYNPYDEHGNVVPDIKPVLPGETNEYIIRWVKRNNKDIPMGLENEVKVENIDDDTELPTNFKIDWDNRSGKWTPHDSSGKEINLIIENLSNKGLQKLMWTRFGKKYEKIYKWLTPILDLLLNIRPGSESIPNDSLLKAPSDITNIHPFPKEQTETTLLSWLQSVLLILTQPLPEAELPFGLLKYIGTFMNKIQQLKDSVPPPTLELLEIEIDHLGRPVPQSINNTLLPLPSLLALPPLPEGFKETITEAKLTLNKDFFKED